MQGLPSGAGARKLTVGKQARPYLFTLWLGVGSGHVSQGMNLYTDWVHNLDPGSPHCLFLFKTFF